MNTIEITIGTNKVASVTVPQILVEGENRTTQIVVVTPAAWDEYTVQCLLTTPNGELIDPVDAATPIELLNTMLDGPGTLKAEFLATSGTDVERTKNAAMMKVLAARDPLGTIAPEPLPDFIAQMVVVKDQASSAASQATQAALDIAGVPAAELVRETNENERISSELLRESEKIKGNDGKKYRIVACVLRNAGGVWNFFEDENHKAINVASVSQTVDDIRLDFTFAASKVGGMTVSPDETYVRDGLSFGASVGTTFATIRPIINKHVGGYIYFNGTSWVISNAPGVISAVWSTDKLVITHGNMYQQSPNIYNAQVTHRGGNYIAQLGSLGLNTIDVEFYDFAGNRITTPTANMKIYFDRTAFGAVRTQDLMQSGSNIWVMGLFEVA